MDKRKQALKYVFADYCAATVAWCLFYAFRKLYIEPQKFGYAIELQLGENFYYGLLFIPVMWVLFYALTGFYYEPYRKSRLKELGQTLLSSIIGVTAIFFTLLLDDEIADYKNYYSVLLTLFTLHFTLTFVSRFILSSITAHQIHTSKIGFNTLLIGSNENALNLYKEIESQKKSSGLKFVGFLSVNGNHSEILSQYLSHLGQVDQLRQAISKKNIEEVIIAIESSEHEQIRDIVNMLSNENVQVKIIPDMYDILSGQVKMTSILGVPLISISNVIMPLWQYSVKRALDIFISVCMLTIGSPMYLIIALFVRLNSKGPIFYNHERIGRYGKPFKIYKFRSMHTNSEKHGPALSSENDSRITSIGKFLRRSRLDELPQFYNVLLGEMSIVGPRPERQYYIDRITQKAPHYSHLHKVRPGITSWGQVKFGYAENVDQMVQRLKYDILYIENMSLIVDFKIMIYTVLTVLRGRGK